MFKEYTTHDQGHKKIHATSSTLKKVREEPSNYCTFFLNHPVYMIFNIIRITYKYIIITH